MKRSKPAFASALDDMKQRLSRLELRARKKRQLALEAMSEVGLKKLEQPDFTASARAGSPALVVVAEDSIPEAYWLPQPPKLDRQALLGELKRGVEIPGAQLSNPRPVLTREDKVMAFTDTQVRQLKAKLDAKHVKTRNANGADLHYVEGWHVIAEANRIFGYDAWDRRTLASHCVWSGANGAYHAAAYTAKVRVSVRAGDITIVREGSARAKAEPLPRGKPTSSRSKAPRPMPPSGRSPLSAIPSVLRFMTASRLACAKRETSKAAPPIRPLGAALGIWCR